MLVIGKLDRNTHPLPHLLGGPIENVHRQPDKILATISATFTCLQAKVRTGKLFVRQIRLHQIHVKIAKLSHKLAAFAGRHRELVLLVTC
jgi:hypothetical protein